MKKILITGSSSGFGFETAKLFLSRNWEVIATMRNPQDNQLPTSDRLTVLPLDVTDLESIQNVSQGVGRVDALVNNAGIGMLGDLEGTPTNVIKEMFDTNTIGTINVTKAFLPYFRQQRSGIIVNVTSSVTLAPHALLSVYAASKAAVNTFSDTLSLELAAFNVRVKHVTPGRCPDTQFAQNAAPRMTHIFEGPYAEFTKTIFAELMDSEKVTYPDDVSEAIWQAVNDDSSNSRIIAGADANALIES